MSSETITVDHIVAILHVTCSSILPYNSSLTEFAVVIQQYGI